MHSDSGDGRGARHEAAMPNKGAFAAQRGKSQTPRFRAESCEEMAVLGTRPAGDTTLGSEGTLFSYYTQGLMGWVWSCQRPVSHGVRAWVWEPLQACSETWLKLRGSKHHARASELLTQTTLLLPKTGGRSVSSVLLVLAVTVDNGALATSSRSSRFPVATTKRGQLGASGGHTSPLASSTDTFQYP